MRRQTLIINQANMQPKHREGDAEEEKGLSPTKHSAEPSSYN